MEQLFTTYWPFLLALLATAVGYGWLQYQVKGNTKDIDELKANQKEEIRDLKVKIDTMSEKLNELCVNLAEFTGYIKGKECKE